MNVLLDTHTFLWWQENSRQLKPVVRNAILDKNNRIYVSCASIWEMAIKASLDKLKIPTDVKGAIAANHFLCLPVTIDHALAVQHLPRYHIDPFDRMLVAQAQIEQLTIASRDKRLKQYGVPVIWE